jgi:hypothetical protein
MQTRAIITAVGGGGFAITAVLLACSGGSTSNGGSPDAGHDVSLDVPITVFETSPADTTLHDSGAGDSTVHDSGHPKADGGSDVYAIDVGPLPGCGTLTGACDLVAQNCSPGAECVMLSGVIGAYTACEPDQASEHIQQGMPCCSLASGANPCDPGLECNGGQDCADAASPGAGLPPGWGGSRCTPRCCPSDAGADPANCGTAGDGGLQGYCTLGVPLTDNGPAAYYVCTYSPTCEPFEVHPCSAGFGCEVENAAGTASCVVISNPGSDAGATSGQACESENQCADGLVCIVTQGYGAGTCSWMCHVNGVGGLPFDAGYLKPEAGAGGCPDAQGCMHPSWYPAWLGFCQPNGT